MLRTLSLTCAALAALASAGCSDGGSDAPLPPERSAATSAPAAADLRPGLVRLWTAGDDDPAQVQDGGCFADALLASTEPAALVDAGVVGADGEVVEVLPVLEADLARAWVDAQGSCTDYVVESSRALFSQSKGSVDQDLYEACLRAAITPEQIDAALVQSLSGGLDSPEVATLSQAQATCARGSKG